MSLSLASDSRRVTRATLAEQSSLILKLLETLRGIVWAHVAA